MDIIFSIIGYVATVFLVMAFITKSVLRLLLFNVLACLLFAAFGIWFGVWQVIIPGLAALVVNIVCLSRIVFFKKHAFEMLRCSKNDLLLGKFVSFNEKDIRKFMPKFELKKVPDDAVCFYLMRDMELAGVWIASIRDSYTYEVNLDYVTTKYRDLKSGKFIYEENKELLLNIGIRYLTSDRHSDAHCRYLEALGFEYREKDRLYKYKM